MRRLLINIPVAYCVLCISLVDVSLCTSPKNVPKHHAWNSEARLLAALGLPADANDEQVIELLDVPGRRPIAIGVIRYRKMTSASDRLVQMVNDETMVLPVRIKAAHALCDFGNKEWIEPLKALVADPNNRVHISGRIELGGLLARAGDYSQFEFLGSCAAHRKRYIRSGVVQALGNFRGKDRTEVPAVAQLLARIATSDSEPWVRRQAIGSLEKIVQERPDITAKLREAAQANLNSDDKALQLTCRLALRRLSRQNAPK